MAWKNKIKLCINGHLRTTENVSKSRSCNLCQPLTMSKWRLNNLARCQKRSQEYYLINKGVISLRAKEYAREPEARYKRAKSDAAKKGMTFNLGQFIYIELISNPCHYCGKITMGIETAIGLDRIDNNYGYEYMNVLPCCKTCNMIRSDKLTVEEMEVAMHAVLNFRSKLGKTVEE